MPHMNYYLLRKTGPTLFSLLPIRDSAGKVVEYNGSLQSHDGEQFDLGGETGSFAQFVFSERVVTFLQKNDFTGIKFLPSFVTEDNSKAGIDFGPIFVGRITGKMAVREYDNNWTELPMKDNGRYDVRSASFDFITEFLTDQQSGPSPDFFKLREAAYASQRVVDAALREEWRGFLFEELSEGKIHKHLCAGNYIVPGKSEETGGWSDLTIEPVLPARQPSETEAKGDSYAALCDTEIKVIEKRYRLCLPRAYIHFLKHFPASLSEPKDLGRPIRDNLVFGSVQKLIQENDDIRNRNAYWPNYRFIVGTLWERERYYIDVRSDDPKVWCESCDGDTWVEVESLAEYAASIERQVDEAWGDMP